MKNVKEIKTPTKLARRGRRSSEAQNAGTAAGSPQSVSDWHEQLAEDRLTTVKKDGPGSHPVGATSSANSITADPFSRKKALGDPVPQVTRHI